MLTHQSIRDNLNLLGAEIDSLCRHLAGTGAALVVLGAVFIIGRVHGYAVGAAATEAAFVECGSPVCFDFYAPSQTEAPRGAHR